MRAKPIFLCTLVASALALPAPAYSLALGRLTVTSALGEPLVAQIELAAATREEIESLTAKVADAALYRQNNLGYQAVLARTRITVERTPDGRAVLRITSPTPVNEPYLDLMVDVNWASGRVVREYTFLLDPPGTATQIAVDPVAPARVGAAPAPAAEGRSAAGVAVPADGYLVRRGDTLSKIAQQYKPADVTLEQMLVALFNANANAFDGANMNRLRAGAIMTVPGAQVAEATVAPEAAKVVRVHSSDWRTYRDRLAAAAPSVDGAPTREGGGRITAAAEDRAGAPPVGRDQVRVSREAGAGRGAAAGAEDAVARNKQLADANARIAELEKTVREMQRAFELRSTTMAQAQQQADSAKGKPAAPPPPSTPITTAPPVDTKVATLTPPPTTAPEPAKVEPPPKAPEPTVAAPIAPAPTTPPVPVESKAPAVTKPAPKPAAPPPEPSFLEDLMGNTPTWAIGAGALALLGGIAALVAARRRKTTKFEDSIISGTDIKTNTVFGSTGGGVVNTGENSLASDFSREGLGNIDTDEVDPIAEAEVYLAYGRDAQAEEILKDALKKDPQRQEIYLKLLEIHAQHNKPSAFETVASELYAVSQGHGETWEKAVALGRQLDPNNPMFAEGGAPPPMPRMASAAPLDSVSFDTDAALAAAGKRALDSQLDEDISIAPTSGATAPRTGVDARGPSTIQRAAESGMDFGERTTEKARASATGAASARAAGKAAAAQVSSGIEAKVESVRREVAERIDLDFQLDDADKPTPIGKRAEALPVGHGVAEAGPLGGTSLTRPEAAIALDKLDLGFDPGRATFEDPTPSVLDGQWHDAATKLDLAKAYQEMGDVEGAREILQEVLHEGDDQQKSEAQALLAKLT